MSFLRPLTATVALILTACTPTSSPEQPALLAIGDSVMAWNGRAGIPEVTAEALGWRLTDASRSLSHVSHPSAIAAATGFDIARQFRPGPWAWVIATGGGNDLRAVCGTLAVAAMRDQLIGPDLRGEIPTLIARIRASGALVLWIGYYDGAEARPTGFSPCQPDFTIMNQRLARLAARLSGMTFLDAGDVIDPSDLGLYARDLIHPSARGSAVIGSAAARSIAQTIGQGG